MILSTAQNQINSSPYRRSNNYSLDQLKKDTNLASSTEKKRLNYMEHFGPQNTYTTNHLQSWQETKREIRNSVENKVSGLDNDLFIKKKDILFGFEQDKNKQDQKQNYILDSKSNQILDHQQRRKTTVSSALGIHNNLSNSNMINRSQIQDGDDKISKSSLASGWKFSSGHISQRSNQNNSGQQIFNSYSSITIPKNQNLKQRESYKSTIQKSFPFVDRQHSLDIDLKIQNASIQTFIKSQNQDLEKKYSSQAQINSLLPSNMKFDQAQKEQSTQSIRKSVQLRADLKDIVKVSSNLSDIQITKIPSLSNGYIQELQQLQDNIQRILNNHKRLTK